MNSEQSHIDITHKPTDILDEEAFDAHHAEAARQVRIARAAPELLAELQRLVAEARANAGRLHHSDVTRAEIVLRACGVGK